MSDCYRETPRTARKAHRCCECMATIEPGERYVVCSGVSEGKGWSYKLCAFCHALFGQIWQIPGWVPEDGPSFGGLCAWLHECFWRDDPSSTEAVIDGVFPLVAEASALGSVDWYTKRALEHDRGSRMRGFRMGQRLAAQSRLRALRASRRTVDGRVAA